MPRREKQGAEEPATEETNEEKILGCLRAAAEGGRDGSDVLSLAEITTRSGVKLASVYLSYMVRRGLAARAGRGRYRLPRPVDLFAAPEVPAAAREPGAIETAAQRSNVDEQAADDIRADERRRIIEAIAKAAKDSVPKETEDWIRGFKEGANFVLETALGESIEFDSAEH